MFNYLIKDKENMIVLQSQNQIDFNSIERNFLISKGIDVTTYVVDQLPHIAKIPFTDFVNHLIDDIGMKPLQMQTIEVHDYA